MFEKFTHTLNNLVVKLSDLDKNKRMLISNEKGKIQTASNMIKMNQKFNLITVLIAIGALMVLVMYAQAEASCR